MAIGLKRCAVKRFWRYAGARSFFASSYGQLESHFGARADVAFEQHIAT